MIILLIAFFLWSSVFHVLRLNGRKQDLATLDDLSRRSCHLSILSISVYFGLFRSILSTLCQACLSFPFCLSCLFRSILLISDYIVYLVYFIYLVYLYSKDNFVYLSLFFLFRLSIFSTLFILSIQSILPISLYFFYLVYLYILSVSSIYCP